MKKLLEQFKLYDYIIVVCCIVFSFFPLIAFAMTTSSEGEKIAIVKINGEEVDRYPIDELDHFEKTYQLNDGKYNIIEVERGRIRNKEDNSPDQIAVKTGWINKPGQIAICIPHDFLIEIVTEGAKKDEHYPIY